MTTTELKSRLHKLVDSIDNVETLKAIYIILKTKNNSVEEPQALYIPKSNLQVNVKKSKKKINKEGEDYTKPGKPMSMEAYTKMIKNAESRIDAGSFITQTDLEKDSEKW